MNIRNNCIIIEGNLGRDPDLKFTGSGKAVTALSVATNQDWFDKNSNTWQKKACWHRVIDWNTAETIAKELQKGDAVVVIGTSETREYEQGGQRKFITEIIAQTVARVIRAPKSEGDPVPPPDEPRTSAPPRTAQSFDAPPPSGGSDDDIPF